MVPISKAAGAAWLWPSDSPAILGSALLSKAKVIILNAEATALDELADVVLRGSISQILPQLVGLAGKL